MRSFSEKTAYTLSRQWQIRAPVRNDTPPNQRKPSGNRRKSGDRTSSQQNNDGERNQHLATGLLKDDKPQMIITLKDCSRSEAYQLLSQRWAAAMHQYNDPTVDLSERPIMYYGGSVWGKLPHQVELTSNSSICFKVLFRCSFTLMMKDANRPCK